MQARDGIVDAIGNTPLIVLKRASAATRCTILGKAEFMNPGQSVKDRPARHRPSVGRLMAVGGPPAPSEPSSRDFCNDEAAN
jgi:hypothetical protein